MEIESNLLERSEGKCELCASVDNLEAYTVAPKEEEIVACAVCLNSISNPSENEKHWNCLNDAMWSEVPAVVVVSYRVLTKLKAQDKLEMMYMEEDVLAWAKDIEEDVEIKPTKDSNGTILNEGDTVTVIKDLPVKGAGFTAKQGTSVKNIHLVLNDNTMIEGRVNGTKIFLLTKFLKKV